MSLVHHILLWLLFLVVCIPLSAVAWSSRRLARDIAQTADYEPKTIDKGPLIDNGDGTLTQSITVSMVTSVSATTTQTFGPIAIVVNAREWAANFVLAGLLFVLIGLLGLLYFPIASCTDSRDQTTLNTIE